MEKKSDYNLINLEKVSVHGIDMFITGRFQLHYQNDKYESLSVDIFSRFAKADSVVLDIGAHYGYYSLIAAKNNATVFSFEPVKENFEILNKNIGLNNFNTVQSYNVALSNEDGENIFNIAEASDSSSFHNHPLTRTIEQRVVKTISLDSFFPNQKIDLIKIDTEGHEIEVLEGMKDVINRNPGIKLLVEFNPKCLKAAGKNPSDLLLWLSQKGFDVFFLNDKEGLIYKLGDTIEIWEKLIDPMGYMNIFCVKRGSVPFISFISHSADMAGAERSLIDLIDGLKQRDVLCHVVLPVSGRLEEELKKRLVPRTTMSYRWWAMNGNEEKEKIENEINAQAIELASVLDDINPDIIYTNTSVISVGALAAKILGKPHIWHIREFGELDHNIRFILPIKERSKFVHENSEYVIYNSKAVEDYYGGDREKSIVIYNNVSVPESVVMESVFKNKESYKLGVLGTVHAGKNQEDAILAVNNLIKEGLNVELVIVGYIESSYGEKLKKIVFDNELADKVRFLGNTPNPYSLLKQIDVLIVSSKNEAFGRVIVEGMLEKKPVVATKSGGVTEIIKDGFNGLLYTSGNYKELAEKLKFLFYNRDKALQYGQNGYIFATEHFDDNKYSGKITQIFDLMGGFVTSGLNSLYKKLWEIKESSIQKKNIEILNLIKTIESETQQKNDIIGNLTEIVNQKNQEIFDAQGNLQEVKSKIYFLEGEKNILNEQIKQQEEKFFEEYKTIQSELIKQVGILNQKDTLIREKEEEKNKLTQEYNDKILAKDSIISLFQEKENQQTIALQLKEQEIITLNNQMSVLSQEVSKKTHEVALMSASKFWRLRDVYMRSKWAIKNPLKFSKKYIWNGIPTYPQIKWAITNPLKFLKKYGRYILGLKPQKKVALYMSSKGNYFFEEIMSVFDAGLSEAGYLTVRKNENDEFGGDYDFHIIIAPQEFFLLGRGIQLKDSVWPQRTILFNAEQPNSLWFNLVEECIPKAYAVWDLNHESTKVLGQKYKNVRFLPIGYTKEVEKKYKVTQLPKNQNTEALDTNSLVGDFSKIPLHERPIDICFIGVLNDRRHEFFSKNAEFFSKYNCYFYFWDGKEPLIPGVNTSMDSLTAHGIIERSKILLNIHQNDNLYFEWHRIVNMGIAHKTLVVSEKCSDGDSFISNIDFISADLNDIPKVIAQYMNKDKILKSQKIVDVAYEKFKNKYPMEQILDNILKDLYEK